MRRSCLSKPTGPQSVSIQGRTHHITDPVVDKTRQVHDVVSVPVSVAMELRGWSAAAVTRRVVAQEPVEDECTTFVDASLGGWGGVRSRCERQDGRGYCLGGCVGPSEQSLEYIVLHLPFMQFPV